MTRWCCVCQQSCRLRMNGCLTCRCQKRTHARTHTDTQTHTDNEWREMDKQTWCPVTEWGCYTRTVHTNSTLLLSLLYMLTIQSPSKHLLTKTDVPLNRSDIDAQTPIFFICIQITAFFLLLSSIYLHEVYNVSSSLILESLLIFRNSKCEGKKKREAPDCILHVSFMYVILFSVADAQ